MDTSPQTNVLCPLHAPEENVNGSCYCPRILEALANFRPLTVRLGLLLCLAEILQHIGYCGFLLDYINDQT